MAIITISRGTQSGGKALAEKISQRLNYENVSREILVEAAQKYGVDEKLLVQAIEKPPKTWDRYLLNRKLYLTFIKSALLERAKGGNLVYHGYSGQFLLKGIKCVLKVRLIAPLEMRISHLMETANMSREDAEQYIKKVDESRIRWTKFLYGADLSDPSLYDLVINLGAMTLDTACDIICNLTEKPEFNFEVCPQDIENAVIGCKVEEALYNDPRTKTQNISAEVRDNTAHLKGYIQAERVRKAAREIAGGVKGVNNVEDELQVEKIITYTT